MVWKGEDMEPPPNVSRIFQFVRIEIRGVVIAQSVSAKVAAGRWFFPLDDIRTEYLFPLFTEPMRDEIGDSIHVAADIGEKVYAAVGRYYFKSSWGYRPLKNHMCFDSCRASAYVLGDGVHCVPPGTRGSAPNAAGNVRAA